MLIDEAKKILELDFDALFDLISHCLNVRESPRDYDVLITQDKSELFKYLRILERKIAQKPKLSIPKFQMPKLETSIGRKVFEGHDDLFRKLHEIKYRNQYRKALKLYDELNAEKIQKIQNLRSKISAFKPITFKSTKLNWKLLPVEKMSFHQLKQFLEGTFKFRNDEIDELKMRKLISLYDDYHENYRECYCGLDDFDGYFVLYFTDIKTAILDCPKENHAIYILGEDWETLSRLSKFQLRNSYPNKTKRIIHKGDWFERLKAYLRMQTFLKR
jgi:hypothetical protein